MRVLSSDANGTTMEVSLRLSGTIRGVAETTIWTYTMLTRADGSVYGPGEGVMTTQDGDVVTLIGAGSSRPTAAGDSTRFRTMLHPHSASATYADLKGAALAGEYDVAPDGSAVNKCWEWN